MDNVVFLTAIASWAFLTITTEAYGTGAPLRSCDYLVPEHYGYAPKDPRKFPNPYSLETVDRRNIFTSGQTLKIRLSGHKFRGFIFQVRDDLDRSRGRFVSVPSKAQALTCRHLDDTITHNTPEIKTDMTFEWRAPDNAKHKVLVLRGTIAESETSFWSDKSIVLYNSLYADEFRSEIKRSEL